MDQLQLTGRIALGGAMFSLDSSRSWDEDVATIRGAVELCFTLFDSARAYARVGDPAHNERLFRTALAGAAAAGTPLVIGTKGGHFRTGESTFGVDNSPERLRHDVEQSLANLGVDALELFYLHRADGSADLSDALQALDDLRREGSIVRVGLSNVRVDQLTSAVRSIRIDAVQNKYSASGAESAEVLALCESLEVPFFAYSPVRPRPGSTIERDFPLLSAIATARSIGIHTLLLRLLLDSSPVMSVVSGATRPQSVAATAAALTTAVDAEIEAAFRSDRAALAMTA